MACVQNNMKYFLLFTVILLVADIASSEIINLKSSSDKINHEAVSRTVKYINPNQYAYGYAPSYHTGYYPHVYPIQPINVVPLFVPLQGGGKHRKHQRSKVSMKQNISILMKNYTGQLSTESTWSGASLSVVLLTGTVNLK